MKKYFILVLGCQMNRSDAEKIEAILDNLGYLKVDNEAEANLIVVVACSIKQSAIDRVYGKAHNWQKRRQQGELFTILTGCVLTKDKKKLYSIFDLALDIKDINQIPEKLNADNQENVGDYLSIKPKHNSAFQAYVIIMTGCNNYCTFCVVPYTRGRETYKPAQEIIAECQDLVAAGYKEITLLGQNVNSYKSGDYDFPKLLSAINKISGNFWIRFLSSNPQDFSDDLIKVMAEGQHITPYLHFAVQSGDDEILRKMNRQHSVEHYLKIIDKARTAIPNLMVSTDIIVGFPTETEDQFNQTVKLVEAVSYDMIYISKYSNRVGTAASKILPDDILKSEKDRREKILTKSLATSAKKNNEKYLNQTVEVLVEGHQAGQQFGKTNTFKTVTFKSDQHVVGQFVQVKITEIGSWGLFGELIDDYEK